MLRFKSRHAAPENGMVVTPYRSRTTNSLLFAAKLLRQEDLPFPTDLTAALQERGISATSI